MRTPPVLLCLCGLAAAGHGAASAATPDEIAALIDRHVVGRWEQEKVTPAPAAGDAEFLRRAWLDLAGTIPPAGKVREFLEDSSPGKRRREVERLLDSSLHVERFAEQWMRLLVPESSSDPQLSYVAEELRSWLRRLVLENTPYDELAMQLLTVPLSGRGTGAMAYYSDAVEPRPTAFYAAKETSPENLAAATARLLLGIRVDCAQCHDHPFADWRRDEFWSYAAFFQGLQPARGGNPFRLLTDLFAQGAAEEVSIAIPDTDRRAAAKFLGGDAPQLKGRRPRQAVAEWIVSTDNPYFARAMVNRTWSQLLGRGLVDPVDDMDSANPASHPRLLDELAAAFAADFDLRSLQAGIMLSAPYQRSSLRTHESQDDPELFARFFARRLDATQVQAALAEALAIRRQPFRPGRMYDGLRAEFEPQFGTSRPPLQRESSVQQVLLLLNGQTVREHLGPQSVAVRGLLAVPGLSLPQRADAIYLTVLSRLPAAEERQRAAAHLKSADDLHQAAGDVFWSLINGAEFIVNH